MFHDSLSRKKLFRLTSLRTAVESVCIISWTTLLFFFALYSYFHVDLNLTLSSHPTYQSVQQRFIEVGYFQRPLSSGMFFFFLCFFFFFYIITLYFFSRGFLSGRTVWVLLGISTVFGVVSYPFLSHDLFNYMFDARIITLYHQNPYVLRALDFPDDLWIRFMHWTHRTYPYGPVWLILSIPFSFLGFGKFVLTLFHFKLLFAASHIGIAWIIFKIRSHFSLRHALYGVLFYSLNPLVFLESVVSPHNDAVMAFFSLLAVYYVFVCRKSLLGFTALLFSVGVKFVTVVLLPLFFLLIFGDRIAAFIRTLLSSVHISQTMLRRVSHRILSFLSSSSSSTIPSEQFHQYVIGTLFFLLFPLVFEIQQREPYPWYFLPFLSFGALVSDLRVLRVFFIGVSMAALLRYVPYLYYGDYTSSMRTAQAFLFWGCLIEALLLSFAVFIRKHRFG